MSAHVAGEEQAGVGDIDSFALAVVDAGFALGEFDLDLYVFGVALLGALLDVGVDGAGADGVDADVVARQLQGRHLHEGDLAGFAGAVGAGAGVGEGAGAGAVDAAGDEDAPAAGIAQVRNREMNGEIGAFEIDVQRLVPLIGLEFLDRRSDAVDAGVGDDDVEPAELFRRPVHRRLHVARLRAITCKKSGAAARPLDLANDLDCVLLLLRDIQDRHGRAFLSKADGRRLPNSAGGAGDERDFFVEHLHGKFRF